MGPILFALTSTGIWLLNSKEAISENSCMAGSLDIWKRVTPSIAFFSVEVPECEVLNHCEYGEFFFLVCSGIYKYLNCESQYVISDQLINVSNNCLHC